MTTGMASEKKKHAARSGWRSETRRDQLIACLTGAVFLAGSVLAAALMKQSRPALVREDPESQRTLESLAVTFPRLVLGGMRGIVSTYLWIEAENDKNDRKWEQLERRYDVIGALQPYFASVYTYHAWNQAYNLSAQWQEQDKKYKWVLDGLLYLYKGEDFNPGNADIILEEAHMYNLKIGGAFERIFYREHWREDQARLHELDDNPNLKIDDALAEVRQAMHRRDARDQSDYLHIQELHSPDRPTSAVGWGIEISDPVDPAVSKANPTGFNLFKDLTDGKKVTDPVEFRYGVSPFYFAYIEYTRELSLPTAPSYTGKQVIDSLPAMSLRLWCRDDLFYTGEIMDRLFGSHPDADLLASAEKFNAKVAEIQDCSRNVAMIGPRAIDLFHAHLQRFPENVFIHTKHILETTAYLEINKAEIKLFNTFVQWHLAGEKLTPELVANFQAADDLYKAAITPTQTWVDNMYPLIAGQPPDVNRAESERFVYALQDRSRGIEALLTAPPGQKPNMDFLNSDAENVVER